MLLGVTYVIVLHMAVIRTHILRDATGEADIK